MAKIQVEPKAGVLAAQLKAKGKTQVELAEALQMSRKTLRQINLGKPVKDETLRKITNYLRIPEEHFIQSKSTVSEPEPSAPDKLFPWQRNIIVRSQDGNGLFAQLRRRTNLHWALDAKSIPYPATKEIRDLGAALQKLQLISNGGFGEDGNLEAALSKLETVMAVDAYISNLAEHGLGLLANNFIRWSLDEEDNIKQYFSQNILYVVIDAVSIKTKRVVVDIGETPPKYRNYDQRIYLDGILLLTEEESNEEIPF